MSVDRRGFLGALGLGAVASALKVEGPVPPIQPKVEVLPPIQPQMSVMASTAAPVVPGGRYGCEIEAAMAARSDTTRKLEHALRAGSAVRVRTPLGRDAQDGWVSGMFVCSDWTVSSRDVSRMRLRSVGDVVRTLHKPDGYDIDAFQVTFTVDSEPVFRL